MFWLTSSPTCTYIPKDVLCVWQDTHLLWIKQKVFSFLVIIKISGDTLLLAILFFFWQFFRPFLHGLKMAAAASCFKFTSQSRSRGRETVEWALTVVKSMLICFSTHHFFIFLLGFNVGFFFKPELCHMVIPGWKAAREKGIGNGLGSTNQHYLPYHVHRLICILAYFSWWFYNPIQRYMYTHIFTHSLL